MDEKPSIFVVDDDQNMVRLITAVLEREGHRVQSYVNASDFLGDFKPGQRGCLILDVEMPGLNGLELQDELRTRLIDLPIIFLTATADVPTAVKAMKRGALDLLVKPFEVPTLVSAVQRALERDALRSEETVRFEEIARRRKLLTPRELEVMDLVVAGNSNKQVAAHLNLSAKTIEIHRGRVMRKMKAESVAQLVHLSVEFAKYKRPG
jgi:FixJ family two-component response regulator